MQRRFVSYESMKDINVPPESSQGAPRGAATVADGLMEQGAAGLCTVGSLMASLACRHQKYRQYLPHKLCHRKVFPDIVKHPLSR